MLKSIRSLLIVVFALFAGACAGRQVRTSMPAAASAQAAPPVLAAVQPAPEAVEAPADVTPTPPAPAVTIGDRRSFQARIDADVRRMLDENDAWLRAEAEKIHRTHVAPSPANNDELVAALRIDVEALRRRTAAADREFVASLDGLFRRIAAIEREQRRQTAVARAERRRASATVSKPENVLAASAAPDPASFPMPKDAATAASSSSEKSLASVTPQGVSLSPPDVSASQSRSSLKTTVEGVILAAILGLLGGLLLARRKSKEFRRLMRDEYEGIPDGTLLVQEIRGGAVHRTYSVLAKIQLQKASGDPADAERREKQWFEWESSDAALAANDEIPIEPSVSLERPVPALPAEPEPPAAPAPSPEAPSAPAPVSVSISSQGLESHSVCGETHLKAETPKEVDAPARTIIFEDQSAPSS